MRLHRVSGVETLAHPSERVLLIPRGDLRTRAPHGLKE